MSVFIPPFITSAFPKLFAINVLGNSSSDWILHPTQKLDYGCLNPIIGTVFDGKERPVRSQFWGTRTGFILALSVIASCNEYASWVLYHRAILPAIQKPVVELFTPNAAPHMAPLHCGTFIFMNFIGYSTWLAVNDPGMDDSMITDVIKGGVFPGMIAGSVAGMWFPIFGHLSFRCVLPKSPPQGLFMYTASPMGFLASVLAVAPGYVLVKGLATSDFGEHSLTPHERFLNGMGLPEEELKEEAEGKTKKNRRWYYSFGGTEAGP